MTDSQFETLIALLMKIHQRLVNLEMKALHPVAVERQARMSADDLWDLGRPRDRR
jgi:hypothetical protein